MRIEIKYALSYVLASFLWSCVEYFTGLESTYIFLHPYFVTPFYILLTIIIYLLAFREKRKMMQKINFRKLFLSGLTLSLFILLFNPLQFYIFNNFINPDFFKDFAEYNIKANIMKEEAATSYFTFTNLLIRGSLYRFIMGLIISLALAWVMRRSYK